MIKKNIMKYHLRDASRIKQDLEYWLSKPLEERIAAVEYFRTQYYGSSARLQRTVRVVQRSRG